MKIIIPMAGMGKRFLAAGYDMPKTLIPIEGKPVLEHVVRRFSPDDDFVFGINQEHDRKTPIRSVLQSVAPHGKIIAMPYEKGGPIATVNNMVSEIRDDEPVIVNYCDFSWIWDYEHFKKTMQATECDGAVICYRGFHPHLLGPNQYATLDADGLWMKAIREKHSWHDNKEKDWTSSGTYYFKKGCYVKKYFKEIEKHHDWRINGEHYVSQIYQLMKEDGLKIFIYEIPYMLQWGTPEDMEEYCYWAAFFDLKRKYDFSVDPKDQRKNMQVLILMAGAGKRFADAGHLFPKPYIPVDGGIMVEKSAKSLPGGDSILFVTRDELRNPKLEERLHREFDSPRILSLNQMTEGQAATALCAKAQLNLEKPLLIGACDHQIFYDEKYFQKLTAEGSGVDALIFTYRNNPNVRRNPQAYGWVAGDAAGQAHSVSVKKALPGNPMKNHAIIGSFWFRKARYFTEHTERMIQENCRIHNEFYIDQAMNYLIQAGFKVHVFEVDAYASWGTPEDLQTYEYWQRYHHISAADLPTQPAMDKKISIVIPAYNEAKNLPGLLQRIHACVKKNSVQQNSEWILVDNGSTDETWKILQEAAQKTAYIKPLRIEVNSGYGNGILKGLKRGMGQVLAWTHADCQTDPEDVLRALNAYTSESQTGSKVLVKGQRQKRSWIDCFFSFGMQTWASWVLRIKLHEINAQPKVFPRALLNEMQNAPHDFSLDLYLLYLAQKKGYRIHEIPVEFKVRVHGEAKGGGGSIKNRWKLIQRTFKYIMELNRRLNASSEAK